jgi:protein-S-isoprenylcysteine O-methyltransferase Ste14
VVVAGLALRTLASGHVKKNAELTTTGPYAYTRNPLYLGSILLAGGFAIAARSGWIVVVLAVMFAAIYLPVVRSEENWLRAQFPEYEEYALRVPRFGVRFKNQNRSLCDGFSKELYLKHREYNALLGTVGIMAALVLKLCFTH